MKSLLKLLYCFTLGIGATCVSTAQLITGYSPTSGADITMDTILPELGWDLQAEIDVVFGATSVDSTSGVITSDGLIQVTVTNVQTSTPSKIVAFYLLKPTFENQTTPITGFGTDTAPTTLETWSMMNSAGGSDDNESNVGSNVMSNTGGWLSSQAEMDMYFGMATKVNENALSNPESPPEFPATGTFLFYFSDLKDESFDVAEWYGRSKEMSPLAFVRWQSIDFPQETSAKGFGWGQPGWDPSVVPVPEPSEIALLAMLGLGGLIFARRRLTKK